MSSVDRSGGSAKAALACRCRVERVGCAAVGCNAVTGAMSKGRIKCGGAYAAQKQALHLRSKSDTLLRTETEESTDDCAAPSIIRASEQNSGPRRIIRQGAEFCSQLTSHELTVTSKALQFCGWKSGRPVAA